MTNHLFSEELRRFLVRSFAAYTSLNQVDQFAQATKSIKKNLIMQNKPNLCVFWAKNSYYEEKQTQTNPIQTQNKANSSLSAALQSQNKPNSNPNKPKFYPPRPCGGQTQPGQLFCEKALTAHLPPLFSKTL